MKKLMIIMLLCGVCLGGITIPRRTTPFKIPQMGADVLIASVDASEHTRKIADYVCDGTDDQEQINAAIQAASSINDYAGTGVDKTCAWIELSAGVYHISDSIIIDRAIRLSGVSGGQTVILLDDSSNCHMIILENIQFTAGDVAHNTTPLGIIEHMMIDGNEDNQDSAENVYVTAATGTDADPTVITKSGEFAAANALVGRRAWVRGTNVENSGYGNLYTITASTADTITLDRNISSGGALTGVSVDVEGWCGIYQETHDYDDTYANGQIDFRFHDIWFDDMAGACISLGHFWNHKIHQCTFEHCKGAAVEFRSQTGTETAVPTSTHIYACFGLDLDSFVRCMGRAAIENVRIFDNIIAQLTGTRFVDIPGSFCTIHDNYINPDSTIDSDAILFYFNNNANGVYSVLQEVNIHDNTIESSGAYDSILTLDGSMGYYVFSFNNNMAYSSAAAVGPTGVAIDLNMSSATNEACLSICGNSIRQHSSATGDVIDVENASRFVICNNMLRAMAGLNEIETSANMDRGIITGNCVGQGIDDAAIGANTVVANNPGDS
jgi:hypothetical protein